MLANGYGLNPINQQHGRTNKYIEQKVRPLPGFERGEYVNALQKNHALS